MTCEFVLGDDCTYIRVDVPKRSSRPGWVDFSNIAYSLPRDRDLYVLFVSDAEGDIITFLDRRYIEWFEKEGQRMWFWGFGTADAMIRILQRPLAPETTVWPKGWIESTEPPKPISGTGA